MKTIILTGASGFIGNRLAEILKEEYSGSYRTVLLTSHNKEGYLCIDHKGYSYDTKVFREHNIDHVDIVIHAGAYAPKIANVESIAENFASLVNTQYLLSHLPNNPKTIIYLSSATVYKDFSSGRYVHDEILINEHTVPNPENQYGLVKYSSELLIRDYARRTGTIFHILRLSSIYGIGDRREQMLMSMIKRAIDGADLELWADPLMVRNQLYIDDCCRLIIRCISQENSLGIVNLVSAHNCTMEEMVQAVVKASGNRVHYSVCVNAAYGKDMRFDASKCLQYLGEERYTLDEGVAMTYEWMYKMKKSKSTS